MFVGIHGNEPAGLKAIDVISEKIDETGQKMEGSIYVVSGNIRAMEEGVRYLDTDLNRLWELYNTQKDFSALNGEKRPSEFGESLQIKHAIEEIINEHDEGEEFIFTDMHTTSSRSCAFIMLNDTIENRELARTFPVPQILGIEENIHGTLLSYINNLGHKAIGFEAGAHLDRLSVKRSEAFLWLLIHNSRVLKLNEQDIEKYEKSLQAHPGVPDTYYEVKYHQVIQDAEKFEMIEGFENFDQIEKDTPLAYDHGELIRAPVNGRIFMPLYQKRGRDGFLIIKEVSEFWLYVSAYLRRSFLHRYLKYLPGVSVLSKHSFEVDLRIARFLVKDIFHLLGYRVIDKNEHTLICYRR